VLENLAANPASEELSGDSCAATSAHWRQEGVLTVTISTLDENGKALD